MKTLVFLFVLFVDHEGGMSMKAYPVQDTVEVCQVRAREAALQTVQESGGKLRDVATWCVEYEPKVTT